MLNEALKIIRNYHNLSQSQLCNELNLSNSYLSEIESGKKSPTLDLLNKYSDYFKIPLSSLMFFSENIEKSKASDKIRVSVAKKIISMLNWVGEKEK